MCSPVWCIGSVYRQIGPTSKLSSGEKTTQACVKGSAHDKKDYDNGLGKIEESTLCPNPCPTLPSSASINRACDRLGDTGCPLIDVDVEMSVRHTASRGMRKEEHNCLYPLPLAPSLSFLVTVTSTQNGESGRTKSALCLALQLMLHFSWKRPPLEQ